MHAHFPIRSYSFEQACGFSLWSHRALSMHAPSPHQLTGAYACDARMYAGYAYYAYAERVHTTKYAEYAFAARVHQMHPCCARILFERAMHA